MTTSASTRLSVPSGGYIFNLSTKGLVTGTYNLVFTIDGDPSAHTISIQVR